MIGFDSHKFKQVLTQNKFALVLASTATTFIGLLVPTIKNVGPAKTARDAAENTFDEANTDYNRKDRQLVVN